MQISLFAVIYMESCICFFFNARFIVTNCTVSRTYELIIKYYQAVNPYAQLWGFV